MWKQQTIGTYTKGDDKIKIEDNSHGNYIVWKNEVYEKVFNSYEKLNEYLMQQELEELTLPKIVKSDTQWHEFSGNGHYKKVISRKKEDGKIQSVIVCQYNDNDFTIYSRETDYDCVECLIEASLAFAEVFHKNPENDLELDAYEVGTHGASGMTERHEDLKSYHEVLAILKEEYNIHI